MNVLLVILRAVHILTGVFWAGAVFTVVRFVSPAIGDAGPEGAKVMGALVKRGFLNVVPGAAVLTILSGLWMFWIDSSGFSGPWMSSHMGMALALGAVFALVGLGFGVFGMRASVLKAMALGQSLAQLPEAAREGTMAQIQALRARAAAAGKIVAGLLGAAVALMAIARYV